MRIKIKKALNNVFDRPKEYIKEILKNNSKKVIATFVLVFFAIGIKTFSFYDLMNIDTNLFYVWFVTCLITILLFFSFKNHKIIPAVIYLILSIIMFADVEYSRFFNRYLSLSVMSQAGILTGIGESLKAAINLKHLMLFGDNLLIFIYLFLTRAKKSKILCDCACDAKLNFGKALSFKNFELRFGNPFTLNNHEFKNPFIANVKENNSNEKFVYSIPNYSKQIISILLILLMAFGGSFSYVLASISNQEFYSYHIKDSISNLYATTDEIDEKDLKISTGTYEKEKDGPLFGVAKGRNLIVIQVESLQNMVVSENYNGQDITPNLTSLINDESTIYFDNYYEQRGAGNTSDAEFATNNSIYGTIESYTYKMFQDNYFRGLPWQLKSLGYQTAALHGYDKEFWNRDAAYPALGFDTFYSQENYKPTYTIGMGIDDEEFFNQSIDYLKMMQQPFYSFLITLSNHYPFDMPNQFNKIKLKPVDKNTVFGNYLNSVNHTDEAIGQFIEELKEAGLYDNSIIAIYGDHFGLTETDEEIVESASRFLGKDYDYDSMMNVPLLIHIPGESVNQTVSISGGQLDFLPTIAYLLGFEKLDTLYFGRNLLTATSGFVCEQAYLPEGSFISDDVIFQMSRDGVFENSRAWNTKTGEDVALSLCRAGYLKSKEVINLSEFYLDHDVLKSVYVDKMSTDDLSDSLNIIEAPKKLSIAGGTNSKLAGTNSKEALVYSYEKGNKYIKMDFTWTEEGSSTIAAKNGYVSMNIAELAEFMKEHKDLYIVAEQDKNILYLLDGISSKYPEIKERIIPEINDMSEFYMATQYGYANIIFSVNKEKYLKKEITDFVEFNSELATVMPLGMINKDIEELEHNGEKIYLKADGYYELR